jgi:hypothetical protein
LWRKIRPKGKSKRTGNEEIKTMTATRHRAPLAAEVGKAGGGCTVTKTDEMDKERRVTAQTAFLWRLVGPKVKTRVLGDCDGGTHSDY